MKEGFADKFTSYVQNKLTKEKNEELFGGQFAEETPKKQGLPSSATLMFSGQDNSNNSSLTKKQSAKESKIKSSHSLRISEDENESAMLREERPYVRKRLKKLRELEQNQCGICLDQIKKRSVLPCKHKFCFDCLQSWFKTSNKCPFCRAETQSFWYNGEEFLVQSRENQSSGDYSDFIDDQEEDQEYEQGQRQDSSQQEEMDYTCYNCENTQQGDTVLICDKCQLNACHPECDPRLKGRKPRGEWFCHFCV